jgi:hypothetical protein
MLKKIKTAIIGFRREGVPAYTTAATYLGESSREAGMYRVASTFADITDSNRRFTLTMTPSETRNYVSWLLMEADYADHLNEGRVEGSTPRVFHTDDA